MKIPAPNYTRTPNVFFDEIIKTLNEGELRIMLVMIRQTFGWHKQWDRISLNQLAEKTGYERRGVCKILNRLIGRNLIEKRIAGTPGMQKCWYSIVVQSEICPEMDEMDGIESQEEMEEFKEIPTSVQRDTPPVSSGTPPQCPAGPSQKKLSKETLKRKQLQLQEIHPQVEATPTVVVVSSEDGLSVSNDSPPPQEQIAQVQQSLAKKSNLSTQETYEISDRAKALQALAPFDLDNSSLDIFLAKPLAQILDAIEAVNERVAMGGVRCVISLLSKAILRGYKPNRTFSTEKAQQQEKSQLRQKLEKILDWAKTFSLMEKYSIIPRQDRIELATPKGCMPLAWTDENACKAIINFVKSFNAST